MWQRTNSANSGGSMGQSGTSGSTSSSNSGSMNSSNGGMMDKGHMDQVFMAHKIDMVSDHCKMDKKMKNDSSMPK
ncbi:MAG: hypothetical protein ACRD72_01685 [Candidatus Angelobacter sp.]